MYYKVVISPYLFRSSFTSSGVSWNPQRPRPHRGGEAVDEMGGGGTEGGGR